MADISRLWTSSSLVKLSIKGKLCLKNPQHWRSIFIGIGKQQTLVTFEVTLRTAHSSWQNCRGMSFIGGKEAGESQISSQMAEELSHREDECD